MISNASELRAKFLSFFQSKGHSVIRSSSLVPDNDPTVLFTTAGMHPLVPYLLGERHPQGTRLTDVQKCIRTGDIEEVGDHVHLTFFEMLGNWSLGDYFKKEAIAFSYEFLTSPEYLNFPLEMLGFTVFAGDSDAPFDEEAYNEWRKLGVSEKRIAKLGKKDNWWGPAGLTGPCGPDTEFFYWTGPKPAPEVFDPSDKRWVEIWNNVFMQYFKKSDGTFEPLKQKNVDTGMGVERVTAILQGKNNCYETELFLPLFAELDKIRGIEPAQGERTAGERIIVDHIRAAVFIMADGVIPDKNGREYVLRRIIRRAIREGNKLGITGNFAGRIGAATIDTFGDVYPELQTGKETILSELTREEDTFRRTLERGTREFEKLVAKNDTLENRIISGKNAFNLYETYGFPIELTMEMAKEKQFTVDMAGYEAAKQQHIADSQTAEKGQNKGGLADHSQASAELHTATHLLHKALRMVLGEHVAQRGCNIDGIRVRFDFSHPEKMTPEQIAEVERIVNEAIKADYQVVCEEMSPDAAKSQGAIGLFGNKYGDIVKVYTIGDFSKEICGGPHAARTGQLGTFKIKKEESSSRGVRRIKAVLEKD